MAVVKNHFETTLSDTSVATHTITGLTSETSTTNVNYVNQEASLYFLRSIHKTLLDAGYSDAVKNELEYSISVFGFKFFVLIISTSSSAISGLYPSIYTYGIDRNICSTNASSYKNGLLINNYYDSHTAQISYNIIVRGDENCISISYSSYKFQDFDIPIIFIAKAKNLITSENSYFFSGFPQDEIYSDYTFIRNKENLYTYYPLYFNYTNYNYKNILHTRYDTVGLNTDTKFICEPILCYYGSFLIHSLLKCNTTFDYGKYYKLGSDIYMCYGYRFYTASNINNLNPLPSWAGPKFLFKIS